MLPGWFGSKEVMPAGMVPPGKILPVTVNVVPRTGFDGFAGLLLFKARVEASIATSTLKVFASLFLLAIAGVGIVRSVTATITAKANNESNRLLLIEPSYVFADG
jgi:hypothetical protein